MFLTRERQARESGARQSTYLGDSVLVSTHCGNNAQCPRIDLLPSVGHNAHDHLLPPLFAPRLAAIAFAQMCDILHYTVHGPAEELLVLVVHGHDYEKLRPPGRVVVHLTKREAAVLKVVRVTCGSRVAHVRKLALVLLCRHLEQLGRHRRIKNEVAVEELDLLDRLVSAGHALGNVSVADVAL